MGESEPVGRTELDDFDNLEGQKVLPVPILAPIAKAISKTKAADDGTGGVGSDGSRDSDATTR